MKLEIIIAFANGIKFLFKSILLFGNLFAQSITKVLLGAEENLARGYKYV
jgi:hypothetical protein